MTIALDGDPVAPVDTATVPHSQWPLNLLKTERDKVKAAVGIDAFLHRKYDEAQKQIASDELALNRLVTQILQAQGAEARRAAHVALRRKLYLEVFEQLVKEEGVLSTVYAPLKTSLVGTKGALGKLAFVTERTVDLERWCEQGENQFDLRSGNRVRGRGGIKKLAEQHLVPAWRTGTAAEVAAAMEPFRDQIY